MAAKKSSEAKTRRDARAIRRKQRNAKKAAEQLRRRREFWSEVAAGIRDEETRQTFRRYLERLEWKPTEEQGEKILNALRDRERHDQEMAQLDAIFTVESVVARWRALREHARQWGELIDFRRLVVAQRMFSKSSSPKPPGLVWADGMLATTESLRTMVSRDRDLDAVLDLAQRMRKVLRGEATAIGEALDAVELAVDRLDAGRVRGGLSQAEGDVAPRPDPLPNLPGHWVPASKLVDADDPAINTAAKVKRFCHRHDVPFRQGTTKHGKPHPQRCDVHLESWQEKRAALEQERTRLQDDADKLTADRSLFDQWCREDDGA